MHFRGTPQAKPTPGAPHEKRRRWSRAALLLLLGGIVAYAVAVPPASLKIDGLLHGDLIPVAPMYRAQINRTIATCYSTVKQGEPLAIVSNFMLDQQYASDYESRKEALQLEKITRNEGIGGAESAVQMARQSYLAASEQAQRLQALAQSYDELYQAHAIGRVASDAMHSDWVRAGAEAAAAKNAWSKAEFSLKELKKANAERIASLQTQLASAEQTRQRVGMQPLLAPAAGQVLDCKAYPNAVIEAGTPVYNLFDTDRAYVMAFADPSEIGSLRVGMPASIRMAGIDKALPGHIAAVTLEAKTLPEPLTRYFWQHNQWSQYRPIKITLDNLAELKPELREKLIFDAKVQVSIPNSAWDGWIGGRAVAAMRAAD